jgi:hypothetical protein
LEVHRELLPGPDLLLLFQLSELANNFSRAEMTFESNTFV